VSYHIELVDPSAAVARQAQRIRDQYKLASPEHAVRNEFWTTGDAAAFAAVAHQLLPECPLCQVMHLPFVDIKSVAAPAIR
jgi:glutamate racemase